MCGVAHKTIHLAHLSVRHLSKYILSYCESSALIMTSALSKSQSVRRYLNNVKLHGCLEREREREQLTHFYLFGPVFLSYFTMNEWLWHGIPHRSGLLLGLHRSNSFHFSTPPPAINPQFRPFIYLPCLITRHWGGHAWLPRCPGSGNVTAWQTGECGQTFVVSRHKPGRLS